MRPDDTFDSWDVVLHFQNVAIVSQVHLSYLFLKKYDVYCSFVGRFEFRLSGFVYCARYDPKREKFCKKPWGVQIKIFNGLLGRQEFEPNHSR